MKTPDTGVKETSWNETWMIFVQHFGHYHLPFLHWWREIQLTLFFFCAIYESFSWHCSLPCAIRILASYALVSLSTTSLSFVSLLLGHFLEKRRTRYELRIRICYQKWSFFNMPLHLLLTAWAVVCRWHPALPVTTGINPETVRFIQYELKQWNCTKISITSSIACTWTRKAFGVNILRSLSQVLETLYAACLDWINLHRNDFVSKRSVQQNSAMRTRCFCSDRFSLA